MKTSLVNGLDSFKCSVYELRDGKDRLFPCRAEGGKVNLAHRWLCTSRMWQRVVQTHIVPWALENVQLGANVLEIGPGPGVTTACLRALAPDLTCIEIDTRYAAWLRRRAGTGGIRVIAGDAAAMPVGDGSFDAVVCFTMLHHVPSTVLQDELLREARRVLRPGGMFVGTDTTTGALFRLFHLFERVTPVNPESFRGRLLAAGFRDVFVDVRRHDFRFNARNPASDCAQNAEPACPQFKPFTTNGAQ